MKKAGNTPLIKKRIYGKDFWIKDESKNPFGTYKDRRSKEIAKLAKKKKINTLALISYGNACYSLSGFIKNSNIKLICIIDRTLKPSIKNILKKCSYKIVEVNLKKKKLTSNDIISLAKENKKDKILEVSNGFSKVYRGIIKEIRKNKPNYIIVPVGSGETFVGLYEGIKKYRLKTKLIGVGVKADSLADKLYSKYTPYQSKIKDILKKGNKIIWLNRREVGLAYKKFRKIIRCEPSSSVVFGALRKMKFRENDKVILINSGRGIF